MIGTNTATTDATLLVMIGTTLSMMIYTATGTDVIIDGRGAGHRYTS